MKKSIITLTILVCAVLGISAQQTAPATASRTTSPNREVMGNKDAAANEAKAETPKACCAGKTAAECKHDGKTCTNSEVKACCADKAAGQCSHDAHASGKTETKACCASGDKKTCNHYKPEEKKKD